MFVIGCCTACATKCQECVPVDDSKESSKEMVIGPRDCAKCEPDYVLTTPTQCDGQIYFYSFTLYIFVFI